MKFLTQFSRLFVGVLFIFSGLIKLNDPMGFGFKLEEYFSEAVLNLTFLEPFALEFAIFVVIFEVLLGVALLIGYKSKFTVWLLFLMNVFFAFLTFYSAYYDKVTDCGCFGDAIPLTPWGSFAKNVIILFFILILMKGMKYLKPLFSSKGSTIVLGISVVLCAWFGYHVLNHLPVKDFRAYAIGKSIPEGMMMAEELGLEPPQYQTIYTLKDTTTGETMEVNDKIYISEGWWEKKQWKIVSDLTKTEKISEGYEPPIHDFSIVNDNGDYTEYILSAPNVLLVISYDLSLANVDGFKTMSKLGWDADKAGVTIMGLSSADSQTAEEFRHSVQAPFEFAVTDKTTLKTIVRSNPGLIYLENGVVKGKWHFNDVPENIQDIIGDL